MKSEVARNDGNKEEEEMERVFLPKRQSLSFAKDIIPEGESSTMNILRGITEVKAKANKVEMESFGIIHDMINAIGLIHPITTDRNWYMWANH